MEQISTDIDDLINNEIYDLINGYRTVDEIAYVYNPSEAAYIMLVNTTSHNVHIRENIYKKPCKRIYLKNLGSYYRIKNCDKKKTCSICLQDFKEREMYRKLNCEHVFHKKCIDNWLYDFEKKSCPLCRTTISI